MEQTALEQLLLRSEKKRRRLPENGLAHRLERTLAMNKSMRSIRRQQLRFGELLNATTRVS